LIKQRVKDVLERRLRRAPIMRHVYAERDRLRADRDWLQTERDRLIAERGNRDQEIARLTRDLEQAAQALTSPINLLRGNACLQPVGCLMEITEDCPLGAIGQTILSPFDKMMYPAVATLSGWQMEEIELLKAHLRPGQRYAAIDIGANIGLFALQVAHRFVAIEKIYCVEPDRRNFRALEYNLSALPEEHCAAWNVALGRADGVAPFFRDENNFGNYSLNADAMRGQAFTEVEVRVAATETWMRKNILGRETRRLIWKSDTQGFDELIVSLTPFEIWERVDVAIIELWRIEKPKFDLAEFRRRIESFPHMSIGIGSPSTAEDALRYLEGDDYRHDDLYMWRC